MTALSINYNSLTKVPVLSKVGTSLIILSLGHNDIAYINETDFQIDTVLRNINLGFNKLTSFPRLSGPAHTLDILDLLNNNISETSKNPCTHGESTYVTK